MVTDVLEDDIIRQVPAPALSSWAMRMLETEFLRELSTRGGIIAIFFDLFEAGELSLSVSLTEDVMDRESSDDGLGLSFS